MASAHAKITGDPPHLVSYNLLTSILIVEKYQAIVKKLYKYV